MNYSQYKSWFENLASRLAAIAHTPEEPRFLFYIDSALPDARKLAKGMFTSPSLVLFPFSSEGSGKNGSTNQEIIRGSFSIVQKHEQKNPDDMLSLVDSLKPIALKVVAALRAEAQKNNGFAKYFTGNEWEGEAQTIAVGLIGYTITFHFERPVNLSVDNADYLPEV
jgi:hypothetical protein